MKLDSSVPTVVRCAGVLVIAQGVVGFTQAVMAFAQPGVSTDVARHGDATVNLLLAVAAFGFGVALFLGARAVRSNVIVFEIIMIGAAGYASWQMNELASGVPVQLLGGAVLYLLLRADVRAWSARR